MSGIDREYILDKLGKIDVLPIFSGIVVEVNNVTEGTMSSAADLAKSKDPSIASEVSWAAFRSRSFENTASIAHAIPIVDLQVAKEDREHAVVISLGNMFAKKINLRDNFSGFDEFLNKYRHFVYSMGDLGMKLVPTEEVMFLECVFIRSKNTKGFIEEVLEEKYD